MQCVLAFEKWELISIIFLMKDFKGKTVWIIGASSGIGEALAREIADQGGRLILSARSEDKLNALADDLGDGHIVKPVDCSDAKAMSQVAVSLERLDCVVFLAAIYTPHSDQPKDIDWTHKALSVNLGGAFNTVHAALPIFEAQGFGHIALCGSVAGYRGLPYGQPYCATKAAIINYAESLKIELEDKNIHVQVINPGFVKTPLTDKNEFEMPMIIEVDEAAKSLAEGFLSKRFEIHFPKKFTYFMKLIDVLPKALYFPLSRLMKKKQQD